MGTTEQWVAAPNSAGPILERGGATPLHVPRGTHGWQVWQLPFEADVGRFDERALGLVEDASTPMLFVWIQDSDFAAILTADVGEVHRTVLRLEAAALYREGQQFLDRLDATDIDSLQGIANWSRTGPRPVEARDLQRALDPHSPVVDAEVLALLDVLGIAVTDPPTSDETELLLPMEGKMVVAGREVDTSKLPYFHRLRARRGWEALRWDLEAGRKDTACGALPGGRLCISPRTTSPTLRDYEWRAGDVVRETS